jgi:hypothetical protein
MTHYNQNILQLTRNKTLSSKLNTYSVLLTLYIAVSRFQVEFQIYFEILNVHS